MEPWGLVVTGLYSFVKIHSTRILAWAFCVNYKVNKGDILKYTQILKSS